MGQQTPGPSTAQHIKKSIENLPHIDTSRPASWFGRGNQRLEDGPLGIREIAGIGCHWEEVLLTFRLFFIHLLLF
jgi:hypothetical protein